MGGFSFSRKLRTAYKVLGGARPGEFWELLAFNFGALRRSLPGGRIRVGTCSFQAPDEATRYLLLRGAYEAPERFAVGRFLRPDLPVVEFGASIGVVSCLVNRRMKNAEAHVAVEAHPELLGLLKENRDRNGCRFEVVHGAAGAVGDSVRFYLGSDALNSSALAVTHEWTDVAAVTLADIVKQRGFDRCALICDIEGAELELIRAEMATLQAHVEIAIMEFHPAITGADAVDAALLEMAEHGFEQAWRRDGVHVFRNHALRRGLK